METAVGDYQTATQATHAPNTLSACAQNALFTWGLVWGACLKEAVQRALRDYIFMTAEANLHGCLFATQTPSSLYLPLSPTLSPSIPERCSHTLSSSEGQPQATVKGLTFFFFFFLHNITHTVHDMSWWRRGATPLIISVRLTETGWNPVGSQWQTRDKPLTRHLQQQVNEACHYSLMDEVWHWFVEGTICLPLMEMNNTRMHYFFVG